MSIYLFSNFSPHWKNLRTSLGSTYYFSTVIMVLLYGRVRENYRNVVLRLLIICTEIEDLFIYKLVYNNENGVDILINCYCYFKGVYQARSPDSFVVSILQITQNIHTFILKRHMCILCTVQYAILTL